MKKSTKKVIIKCKGKTYIAPTFQECMELADIQLGDKFHVTTEMN